MSNSPNPPSPAIEKPRQLPWRRFVTWTFWIVLAVSAVLYVPKEISYWLLAAAEKASQEGRTEEALQWADRAARFNPSDLRVIRMRAQALLLDGREEEALQAIDAALARSESDDLREARLNLLFRLGREREAIDEIARHGAPDGASLNRRLAIAQRLSIVDRYPEALDLLKDARSSDPKQQAVVHLQRAEIYKEMQRFDEALGEIELAQKLHPHQQIAIQRSEILLHLGRFDDVAKACQTLEDDASFVTRQTDAAFNNTLAYFRAVAGRDLEAAETQAKLAVKLSGGLDPSLLDTRGYVYYRMGQHEEALGDFQKAVSQFEATIPSDGSLNQGSGLNKLNAIARQKLKDKTLAVLYYHRSLALEALGKTADAEADRAKVRELGFEPDDRLF